MERKCTVAQFITRLREDMVKLLEFERVLVIPSDSHSEVAQQVRAELGETLPEPASESEVCPISANDRSWGILICGNHWASQGTPYGSELRQLVVDIAHQIGIKVEQFESSVSGS
jgi:hypothetical protein